MAMFNSCVSLPEGTYQLAQENAGYQRLAMNRSSRDALHFCAPKPSQTPWFMITFDGINLHFGVSLLSRQDPVNVFPGKMGTGDPMLTGWHRLWNSRTPKVEELFAEVQGFE